MATVRTALQLPLLVVPLAAACGGDSGVKVLNEPPAATITFPTAGEELVEGRTVELRGAVADDNHAESDLVVTWRVDGVDACGPESAPAGGEVRCELTPDGTGEITLTLVAEDPLGEVGTATVDTVVVATSPPTAEITAPADGAELIVGGTVTFAGVVSDLEDGASELSVAWRSSLDGDLPLELVVDSDGTVSATGTLTEGAHTLTMTVEDRDGKTDSDSVSVSVVPANGAPVCAIDSPADGAVFEEGAGVRLEGTVSDAEQAAETLAVSWSSDVDGALGSSTPDGDGGVTLTPTLSLGDHIVTMTVTDDDELPCRDNVEVVVDSAPAVEITEPADGTIVQDGAELVVRATAVDAQDAETDLVATWTSDRDGELLVDGPDSDGDLVLRTSALSAGDHDLTLSVEDTVGLVGTERLSVTVNGQPSAPGVLLSPEDPFTDDDLDLTITAASVDPEGDVLSYVYTWTVDGETTSYTDATVPAAATTRDEIWEVTVVAADDDGGESEPVSASVTIQNSPPVLTLVSLSPSAPQVDDTITANVETSDADGDDVGLSYAWTVDGDRVSETDSSLSGAFAKGEEVEVVVTPEDDADEGDSESDTVTVVNSPPGAPGVEVTPAEPYAYEDTLACTVTTESIDADGDEVDYAYAWRVDGEDAGVSTRTVSGAETAPGEEWTCRVTPSDDEEEGEVGRASVVVLGDPVDYAHIQYPCSATAAPGETVDVYGWVYELGVTDRSGEGAGITAQVGVGPADIDPTDDDSAWTFTDAAYTGDKDGLSADANDEYLGTVTAPDDPGEYAVVFRFSTDAGASWVWADLGPNSGCGGLGTTDGFDLDDAMPLSVED